MGGEPVRLYVPGSILGYRRSKSDQYTNVSLIKIHGCESKAEVDFYLGKRIAYIYKAKTVRKGTRFRVIWGKVARPHGNIGVIRAKFRKNLPCQSLGGRVRVMLYPSSI
ncbi:hypothetical protein WJX84_005625 [Apatococcus fuscideae]|uniref:60S ribosomal protein L35a n=1 Tax=Apatococcus fuscideae TaxID=2026836 RepID=A0AAW1SV80_9CHLO